MYNVSAYPSKIRNVPLVDTDVFCHFKEFSYSVHPYQELLVEVQGLLALLLIHLKVLF